MIFNPTYGLLNYVLSLAGLKPLQWLATGRTAWLSVSIVVFSYTLGTQLILFLAGLANIPEELHDAAKVDGANSLQIAARIDVPLLRPVLAFVVAIQIIGVFQLWETIYVLTFGGPRGASASVVFQIYQTAFQFSRYGLGSAMGIVLMVIIVARANQYHVVIRIRLNVFTAHIALDAVFDNLNRVHHVLLLKSVFFLRCA